MSKKLSRSRRKAALVQARTEMIAGQQVARVQSDQILTMLTVAQNQQPQYNTINYENLVKQGYRKNALIYTAINKIAMTAASVQLKVWNTSNPKRPVEVANHPLRQLIKHPNPLMSEFFFWWFSLTMLKIAGRAYWQKVRDGRGNVIALWPMRPDWVQAIPGQDSFIRGYFYGNGQVNRVFIEFTDVLDFQLYDPLSLYQSLSPLQVASREVDVDNSITDFVKLFFERGGMPMGLLTSKLKLTDTDIADIRHRWGERYGGIWNWADVAVLDSDATFQKMSLDFKEMAFTEIDARIESRIAQIFDIPSTVFGSRSGTAKSTNHNVGEQDGQWWNNSLIPQYKMLSDEVLLDLGYDFVIGDNLEIRFDTSGVAALQEDRTARFTRANAAWTAGAFTLNDYYVEIGQEPIGDPGEIRLIPGTAKIVHSKDLVTLAGLTVENATLPPPTTDSATPVPKDENKPQIEANPKPKLLLPENVKYISGVPLPHEESVNFADFSQFEIDGLFEEWQKLPRKLS